MDEFGFPPLEAGQTNATYLGKREERIIKRLKGKGVFGEIPFMLRLQTSRHLLDRGMARFMQSSVPYFFHPVDYAERPRSILPNEVADFLDVPIQRTSPQLMGGFIPTRSLTGIDLDNLDTEIPMSDIVNNI